MGQFRAIISGGGTGGHIFPALAIANELKALNPEAKILFVGALGRMEMEKVPAAGYPIIGLPVIGFPRKPGVAMLKFGFSLIASIFKARKVINEFKPDIAIGVGGYASGPTLRAAARKRIPTLIQEQNSYAGITNKLLSKKVDKICVAYDNMSRFFPSEKIILTGNPIRKDLLEIKYSKEKAKDYYKVKQQNKTILIVGGSLGARSVNNAVLRNIKMIRESGIEIIWQAGALYFEEMETKTAKDKPVNLNLHKFLSRMDLAYKAADLVISRAGASTISELCVVGKPSILVPSPNVAEDHQTKNALALVGKGAAVMVKDNEIDEKLFTIAFELMNNKEELENLARNCKELAKPEATQNIVKEVQKLIGND